MPRKKSINVKLSDKLYEEVKEAAAFVGITKEEYILFLILRTQPIPVQVPIQAVEPFHPDMSVLEAQSQGVLDRGDMDAEDKDKTLKFKKQEASYLG